MMYTTTMSQILWLQHSLEHDCCLIVYNHPGKSIRRNECIATSSFKVPSKTLWAFVYYLCCIVFLGSAIARALVV